MDLPLRRYTAISHSIRVQEVKNRLHHTLGPPTQVVKAGMASVDWPRVHLAIQARRNLS